LFLKLTPFSEYAAPNKKNSSLWRWVYLVFSCESCYFLCKEDWVIREKTFLNAPDTQNSNTDQKYGNQDQNYLMRSFHLLFLSADNSYIWMITGAFSFLYIPSYSINSITA